ncbi:hypothetical protein ICN18_02475 [Polynucleobacter sp. Ross1-W9]|uniref:hypothetical protein n=1 Tax=Polynucleobacter parvulilacunae TaxID=1855631 RepID=UPI001C0B8CAA|nr:hypothetical protein [Polynucleobacter parvulilacunae]MBU3556493.1 hypothetical protein [Polynucleobacter parvulilacunae]
MGTGDMAAWAQAIGTFLAILAAGLIATCQSQSQYQNSLKLQKIQDWNKEVILCEAVVEIIKNSAERVRYVFDTFQSREDIIDVATKLKHYDFECLNDVIESLKQIPLNYLPSANLVSDVMAMISAIRQLDIQVDKATYEYKTIDATKTATFLTVVSQIKNSTKDTHTRANKHLTSIKSVVI